MFYIHRYLRLTGVYAFIIFLHASVMGAAFVGGPANTRPGLVTKGCREKYWRNLLYSTNVEYGVGPGGQEHWWNWYSSDGEYQDTIADSDGQFCLGQVWYLNCDMQMFMVVLPFILYPMWKWKIPGLVLAGVYVAGSIALPLGMTISRDWPASAFPDGRETDYFDANYIKPWHRFSPYIVGILLGYLLHQSKKRTVKIPRPVNVVVWLAAFGIGFSVIYGPNLPSRYGFSGPVEPFSQAENAIYGGFHRFAWAMAVAWVIFACHHGYGGWINELLSWEAFQPLAKLTYVIYLMHLTIIMMVAGYTRFEAVFDHYLATLYVFALMAINVAVAAVIHVGVELPWLNLEKFAFDIVLGTRKSNE